MIEEILYREIPISTREGLKSKESPNLKELVEKINQLVAEVNNLKLAVELEVKTDNFFEDKEDLDSFFDK